MYSFQKTGKLSDFQKLISDIYSFQDDRLYSIWDLLVQQERFTMRALKGVRKRDIDKVKTNLIISFSWLMSISNRLHIDVENEVWKRFPMLCSYCGKKPCVCKANKITVRVKMKIKDSLRPANLKGFQKMFNEIYPAKNRTTTDAGVHVAEEMGEESETIHNSLGQHLPEQFEDIKLEIADFISCVFGLANSADINVAQELSLMFKNNCHVCHKAPCICSFTKVINIKS